MCSLFEQPPIRYMPRRDHQEMTAQLSWALSLADWAALYSVIGLIAESPTSIASQTPIRTAAPRVALVALRVERMEDRSDRGAVLVFDSWEACRRYGRVSGTQALSDHLQRQQSLAEGLAQTDLAGQSSLRYRLQH